jgi:glycosyltransferase involved in cell wall biosynthesis
MLVRNEADVIAETLVEVARWGIERIVILDGGSDDGTIEAIEAFNGMDVNLHVSPDPKDQFADHRRSSPERVTGIDAATQTRLDSLGRR